MNSIELLSIVSVSPLNTEYSLEHSTYQRRGGQTFSIDLLFGFPVGFPDTV